MKNPAFTYHRPTSLAEALDLLAEIGDDAKVLAGGQSLLPIMALRLGPPAHLIDIGRIPALDTITVAEDGSVGIGALVRHFEAEHSPDVAAHAPLVHRALPHVGHRAIRTRGTVVGSIAHADPAAEMPAVVLATGATMAASSAGGTRTIEADQFFRGYLQTALRADELLTEVRFPAWPDTSVGTVVEVSRRHGDYALAGLVCRLDLDGPIVTGAALAFFGVDTRPVRVDAAEERLVGREPTSSAFADAADIVSATLEPTADVHGTASYRRHLAGVLTRRALTEATAEIGIPA